MRVPLSWLAAHVDGLPTDVDAVGEAFVRVGLEVEDDPPRPPDRSPGPLVAGRVAGDRGADRAQEADPLVPGRHRSERTEGPRGRHLRRAQLRRRRPRRGRPARRGAARRVRDLGAQDLRARLRRHDRLGARAGHRRRPRRHPRAPAGRRGPRRGRHGAAGPRRPGDRAGRHPGPRLLLLGARAGPRAGRRVRLRLRRPRDPGRGARRRR